MKKVYISAFTAVFAFVMPQSYGQNNCEVKTTTPASVCTGSGATLKATPNTGSYIRWYDQQTGGNLVQDSSNTLIIPNATSSTTYYAEAFGGIAVDDTVSAGLYATNGNRGAFFDVEMINTVKLTDISWIPTASSTYDIDIYYKQGSASGSESNSGAWTKIGSVSNQSTSSTGIYKITLSTQPVLNANQTYGFFVVRSGSGSSIHYHTANTPGAGNVWYQNSDMKLIVGNGASGIFTGISNSNRMFDGILWYERGGVCKSNREPVTLDVVDITKINQQTLNDTGCIGLPMDLSVTTQGNILNYKWQLYNTSTMTYDDISGNPFIINGNTLNITQAKDTLDGAIIRCIALGQCGDATSKDMKIVVDPLPTVVVPPSDLNLEPGDYATFKVQTNGSNVSYRWQVGVNDTFAYINDGGIYTGSRTNTLTVSSVAHAQNKFQFRCIISGKGNCKVDPDTSNFAVLYVSPPASVNNTELKNGVVVYPNPTSGNEIFIKPMGKETHIAGSQYTITNKLGRVVAQGTISTSRKTTVDVTNLAADVYNITIVNEMNAVAKTIRFTRL